MDTLVVCEKGKEKVLFFPGPTVTVPEVNSVAQKVLDCGVHCYIWSSNTTSKLLGA